MSNLSQSDVRGAVEQAMISVSSNGDPDKVREELDFEYLTQILNDLYEQEVQP